MTQTLTPGRYRGLKMTANDGHIFNILAFDQRGSYRKMLPAATSFEDAVAIKREVVVGLAPHVTAVLLDNQYGLPSVLGMRGGCGVLMSLEESGYSGDATYRRLQFNPDWTAAKIRRMGASAVKLLAYYHPHSGALADEIEQVVRQVVAECHAQDLPVFLEPMSYSLDANIAKESAEFARTRPEVVIETARRLTHTGADVLKLEFPVDAAFNDDVALWQRTCEQVSAAATVPWVLLSAGVDFETFATQTDIACRAGASGWLAGRAIWKECVTYSPAERQAFLAGTAVTRTQRLNVLAHQARPWTDFYSLPATGSDWYTTY